jgi:tricorn protease
VAERWPAWSPDGKTIAYWSDRSGEYELYTRPADGSAPEKKITSYGPGFRYHLFWSPDSKRVAFVDQAMGIHICEIATGRTVDVDKNHFMFEGNLEAFTATWSPDSRWLAYTKDLRQTSSAIGLFDLRSGKATQVTSGFYGDYSPAFDPDGKYLYFLSGRSFEPLYSNVDNSWVYPYNVDVVAVPLTRATASPLATRSDEEKPDTTAKPDTTKSPAKPAKPDKKKEPAATPTDTAKAKVPVLVDIDLDGFEGRLVVLPPRAGNYADLQAVSGAVIYRRFAAAASGDSASPVLIWDLKSREESVVVDDADQATLTADGKKLLVVKRDRYAFVEPKPKQKIEKSIDTGGMEAMVDPRAEWRQMFNDVWRFERDMFYDPGMHGVDWNAMRTRYGTLLDDAVTRWDVNFVIGELIAELNSSHTYRGGGDLQVPPSRGVGLLGVDWNIENGAARIARIIDGAPWDNEVRSPLREPGVTVKEGDYVLAVNGVPLDPKQDPWAAFQGLAGKAVELTVNDKPTMAGARRVLVTTLSDESRLRNLAWIESNRERVEKASSGKVGYIYVPNTGTDGQTELVRQFSGQFDKAGLVVDERFNSGGQIPDRFIELLNRPALSYWAVRDGTDWQWPPVANFGPKVMLINGWSGSGGDAFPYYFKEAKLGPLIGLRTWGGLIGISGAPTLVDGGAVTVPTFRMYGTNGAWFAEGHGVDPDIAVVDDPTALAKGQDPQLDRGVAEVMRMLKEQPAAAVKRPPYENRTPKP